MRFIVKPSKFRRTPLLLKRSIPAQKLVSYPGRYQPALDYTRDLFLAFPKLNRYPNPIVNIPESYPFIADFYAANKAIQRKLIGEAGIKTPESYASHSYIVRPLHHFGGFGYRITSNPDDYDPATEYISPAFSKWREYRTIFVKGNPLVLLRKKPGPEAGPFDPWNHANGGYFQTIHDRSGPLFDTSFFEDVSNFCVSRDTHLIGVDVLIDSEGNYAVTEFNFSPALTIPSNIEVISHVFARS